MPLCQFIPAQEYKTFFEGLLDVGFGNVYDGTAILVLGISKNFDGFLTAFVRILEKSHYKIRGFFRVVIQMAGNKLYPSMLLGRKEIFKELLIRDLPDVFGSDLAQSISFVLVVQLGCQHRLQRIQKHRQFYWQVPVSDSKRQWSISIDIANKGIHIVRQYLECVKIGTPSQKGVVNGRST
jgi:hypothetical protein